MTENGLTDWSFGFDRSVKRFGVCRLKDKRITLSGQIVQLNSEEKVRETILHEIAHALCPVGTGHGLAWRLKCRELGIRPERCYTDTDTETPELRYQATCPNCGHTFHRARRPQTLKICARPACRYRSRTARQLTWTDTATGQEVEIEIMLRPQNRRSRPIFAFNSVAR